MFATSYLHANRKYLGRFQLLNKIISLKKKKNFSPRFAPFSFKLFYISLVHKIGKNKTRAFLIKQTFFLNPSFGNGNGLNFLFVTEFLVKMTKIIFTGKGKFRIRNLLEIKITRHSFNFNKHQP